MKDPRKDPAQNPRDPEPRNDPAQNPRDPSVNPDNTRQEPPTRPNSNTEP